MRSDRPAPHEFRDRSGLPLAEIMRLRAALYEAAGYTPGATDLCYLDAIAALGNRGDACWVRTARNAADRLRTRRAVRVLPPLREATHGRMVAP